MKKKIFVAINVHNDIKKEIKNFQKVYQTFPFDWLNTNDLHITIMPSWEEEFIKNAKDKLDSLQGIIKPFSINFNHITLGPSYYKPKLIWAKGKSSKELYFLNEKAQKIFQRDDSRKFKLHLTLGRFGHSVINQITSNWQNTNIVWSQNVEKLSLIELVLDNDKITYSVLKEINL